MDSSYYSTAAKSSFFLLFMAHNAATQFFSVYLKYLGVSASDIGTIRAFQTWIGVATAFSSSFLSRVFFSSTCGRKSFTALLLLTSVTSLVSLVFVPPFVYPRDVTHCIHPRIIETSNNRVSITDNHNVSQDGDINGTFPDNAKKLNGNEADSRSIRILFSTEANRLSKDQTKLRDFISGDKDQNKTPKPASGGGNMDTLLKNRGDKTSATDGMLISNVMSGMRNSTNSHVKLESATFNPTNERSFHRVLHKDHPPNTSNRENSGVNEIPGPSYNSRTSDASTSRRKYYQWRGRDNNVNLETQTSFPTYNAGTQGKLDKGKTFVDPLWKTFEKVFLRNHKNDFNVIPSSDNTYRYKQKFHEHRNQEQQSQVANVEPYYSHNSNTENRYQQEENINILPPNKVDETVYRQQLPASYEGLRRTIKRSVYSAARKFMSNKRLGENGEIYTVFNLEHTADYVSDSEDKVGKLASKTMVPIAPGNHIKSSTKITLNNYINNTSKTSSNLTTKVNPIHAYRSEYVSILWDFHTTKHNSWSTVFYTVVAISLLLEACCQSSLVWLVRICGATVHDFSTVIREIDMSHQILIGWAVLVCPFIGLMVVVSPCPYQITAHMAVAAALTLCALALLPWVSPVSRCRKRKPSKPSYRETYEGLQKRFNSSLKLAITGCITACNLEFMMWHMETQDSFAHNYEYLYCGYSAIASLTNFLLNRLLTNKNKAAEESESESEDDSAMGSWKSHDSWTASHLERGWLWEFGTLLLGIQQLAAQLQPVWLLPPLLGLLQGAGHALSFRGTARSIKATYGIGYGCGCLVAGLLVQKWGAFLLFRVMGLGASVCAVVAAIIKGVLRCINRRRQLQVYSFSVATTESGASSDDDGNEIADTDDWLVQALQQDEYRQAKRNQGHESLNN